MGGAGGVAGDWIAAATPAAGGRLKLVVYTFEGALIAPTNDSIPSPWSITNSDVWLDGGAGADYRRPHTASGFRPPRHGRRCLCDDHSRRTRGNPGREALSPAGAGQSPIFFRTPPRVAAEPLRLCVVRGIPGRVLCHVADGLARKPACLEIPGCLLSRGLLWLCNWTHRMFSFRRRGLWEAHFA